MELAGIPKLRFRLATLPPSRENQARFFLPGGSVMPLYRLHNTKNQETEQPVFRLANDASKCNVRRKRKLLYT